MSLIRLHGISTLDTFALFSSALSDPLLSPAIFYARLDAQGHLRLTDFGLAKSGIVGSGAEGGTKTFCGTPEYLAPEILENKGHGKGVDWWALGTLVFEVTLQSAMSLSIASFLCSLITLSRDMSIYSQMLTGLPPYYDMNVQRMYHRILHEPLKFPRGDRCVIDLNCVRRLKAIM